MKPPLIESPLSLAILGLLSIGPMSGYDLRKVFLTTAMKTFSASPGAIYPALRRLAKDALIEGAVDQRNALRPRRVFTLSRRGKAALGQTLTQPVAREDVVQRMGVLLLRFSFMSGLVEGRQITGFLQAFATETEAYAGEMEATLRENASRLPFSGRASLELGIESFRMNARWARKIREELAKRQSLKRS
jgi:DNA-binding PadR family transcriptional regulator